MSGSPAPEPTVAELARDLYGALARGDGERVEELLDPSFEGLLAEGLPLALGGRRTGPAAMRELGWWAIGREFAVRAEPREWISCADGRLLVLGRYVGTARATGRTLDAAFAHLWSARGGRLVALWQLTDTALWAAALAPQAARP
jgi:ketosteroid isomerase-like protein